MNERRPFLAGDIDPIDYLRMDIIEGLSLTLVMHPATSEDLDYFVHQIKRAEHTGEDVTVSIRGFGLDCRVFKTGDLVRIPRMH